MFHFIEVIIETISNTESYIIIYTNQTSYSINLPQYKGFHSTNFTS